MYAFAAPRPRETSNVHSHRRVVLSLGIGVNTGIFTVLRALLLQPLPHARMPDRLASSCGIPRLVSNITQDWFSTAQYFDIKDGATAFDDVAVAIGANYNLAGDGVEPERIGCIRVVVEPAAAARRRPRSRTAFSEPDDDVPGRAGTAILSSRHVDAPLRRRSRGDRPDHSPQRSACADRRRPESRLYLAARSDAHAGRRRGGRDLSAAPRCRRLRVRREPLRTTTSSPG